MTAALRAAFAAEVARRKPGLQTRPALNWKGVEFWSLPEPCESCGTTVVALAVDGAAPFPYEFLDDDGSKIVRMRPHSPTRCRRVR